MSLNVCQSKRSMKLCGTSRGTPIQALLDSSCFAARNLFERSKDSALATKTAAQNIQPGQYKADRDFVSDCTREVSKNVDARFKKSPGSLG